MTASPSRFGASLLLSTLVAVAVSCGGSSGDKIDSIRDRAERCVNTELQDLIDEAETGATVRLPAGVHKGSIVVDRDDLVIEGASEPTEVVLDGGGDCSNGIVVTADHVSIRGLTTRNFLVNGVFFNGTGDGRSRPIDGFEVRGVVAYNNGLYGIYAFEARSGSISDTFTSGHPDSGIYVGQCDECDVVVERADATGNAVGFEGTNASGVWVVDSVFVNNRVGITPNTQDSERYAPQTASVVAGNLVRSNNADRGVPEQASGSWGLGIAVGGGVANVVANNRVEGHQNAGIIVTMLGRWAPMRNRVVGNVLDGNRVDLVWAVPGAAGPDGNCFMDNDYAASLPADIEQLLGCSGPSTPTAPVPFDYPPGAPGTDWRELPEPDVPAIHWSDGESMWGVPSDWTIDDFAVPE